MTIIGLQSDGSIIRGSSIRVFNPNPIPDHNPKSYRRIISH